MANISDELNNIKHAVLGKDVRDSIHDAIKKTYDDASIEGNANMEVSLARGSDPTLGDRLNKMKNKDDELTQQLAEKAKQSDVFLKSQGININDWDEPTRQAILEAQGIDVNYILGEENVKPINTTFFEMNKNKFTSGWEAGIISAVGVDGVNANAMRSKDFIRVLPITQYAVKFTGLDGVHYYYVYYDSENNFISRLESGDSTFSFTTPVNAVSVRFATFKSNSLGEGITPATSQLELGSVATEYVPSGYFLSESYLEIDNVANRVIADIDPLLTKVNDGLLDVTGLYDIKEFEFVKGSLSGTNGSHMPSETRIHSDYIKIDRDSNLKISNQSLYKAAVHFYDNSNVWLRQTSWLPTNFYTVPKNSNVRIIFAYMDDRNITNIPELVNKFTLQTVENLSSEVDLVKGLEPYDSVVHGIAHRGFSSLAPENTIHAYTLAKKVGFRYVETDVRWTSDGHPIMHHNPYIDVTSNGTGYIIDMTLEQLQQYDFGSWKNPIYAGTKILTFEDFIQACKKLNLHPYIELKTKLTDTQAEHLVETVRNIGMLRRVSWIGGFVGGLDSIRMYDDKARVGGLATNASEVNISAYVSRITAPGNVFLDMANPGIDKVLSDLCTANGIGLETYTVNDVNEVLRLAKLNVQKITTDGLNIPKVLLESV